MRQLCTLRHPQVACTGCNPYPNMRHDNQHHKHLFTVGFLLSCRFDVTHHKQHQPATSSTIPLRTPMRPDSSTAGARPTTSPQTPSMPGRNSRSRVGLCLAAVQPQPHGVPLLHKPVRTSQVAIPQTVPPLQRTRNVTVIAFADAVS